jgi:prophage maintenance system killer protein
MTKKEQVKKGEIVIYRAPKGEAHVEVRLEKETVWLDAHQIALVFGVNRPAIVKHINNIYKIGELNKDLTCSILEQVAADGKVRQMNIYNLDMIISVGYRTNSGRATQFRIWATKTLKNHLIKGYTINEKRLLEAKEKFQELQTVITFLQEKSQDKLLAGQEQEILHLLSNYSKTLTLLNKYDKNKLETQRGGKGKFILNYDDTRQVISAIKKDLIARKEASEFFGQEYDEKFKGIIGSIHQSFGGKELYSSIEEKAAHFLYFVVKDHPFIDGNKRIASFLFIYFLDRNQSLYKKSGEKKINDNALIVLALLIAVSDPKEKDVMTKLTTNLIS